MLSLAIVVALAYVALVVVMYLAQRALMYPGAGLAGAIPTDPPWGEIARLDTPDGETLFALHEPAPRGRPTVLLFHGNADRITQYGFLAEELARRDIGLLAVSYRGFTGSTGRPTESGLLADGVAAFDWLVNASNGPIVPLGQSLGSGVAVHLARERPAAAGVILVSAYDSVIELASSLYAVLPVRLLLKDTFRSDLWIADVRQPKLFVHGARDAVIPLARGQGLFERAGEPKTLRVYDAHGHNDIWGEQLIGDVAAFVEEVAGG